MKNDWLSLCLGHGWQFGDHQTGKLRPAEWRAMANLRCNNSELRMTAMGQKPALPRRGIDVRFAPNKQTLTERVQCDAMCQEET
jgi:hypothetical protein